MPNKFFLMPNKTFLIFRISAFVDAYPQLRPLAHQGSNARDPGVILQRLLRVPKRVRHFGTFQ